MNKLKQMYYGLMLERTKKSLRDNSEMLNFENQEYNRAHIEQLRLMSCKSYLENKLSIN